MTTSRDDATRTARLFRNQRNLAVRIPTDWVSPDADVSEVELSFNGAVITMRPLSRHRAGEVLKRLKERLDQDPALSAELAAWETPDDPLPEPVDLDV